MRKSKLLTFFFSLFPGAGQMYLGYMKRGLSLMCEFFGVIAICMFIQIEFLLVLLPIIWFYSFFDALNLRMQTYDEPYCPTDDYLIHMDFLQNTDWGNYLQKRHLLIGIVCIFFGAYLIFTNIVAPIFYNVFGVWLYDLLRLVPTILVSFAIIVLGIHLIKGDDSYSRRSILEDDLKEFNQKEEH